MAEFISTPKLHSMEDANTDKLAVVKANLYRRFLEHEVERLPEDVEMEDVSRLQDTLFSPIAPARHRNLCESEERMVKFWPDHEGDMRRSLCLRKHHVTTDSNANQRKLLDTEYLLGRSKSSYLHDLLPASTEKDDCIQVVNKRMEVDNLTGDGRTENCLPTVKGRHLDLNNISCETMADVLMGVYDDVINTCRIIDCRYPYEYKDGHIKGAENMYTQEQILRLLRKSESNFPGPANRDLLLFYCEFSSQRAPKTLRFVRAKDREQNRYPHLTYPEVYLLEGGYRAFFENFKHHCDPMSYKPMLHKSHTEDLRHFRKISTFLSGGMKRRAALRLRI